MNPLTDTTAEVGPEPAPRFSVIMNVFNGEPYLRAAIDSLFAQDCSDWELIIWDDCSSDGSPEICREYAKADPRVRYIRSDEHVSIGEARNRAMRYARADWLAFLDQDDLWLPRKLSAQDELIRQDATGLLALVYGRTLSFGPSGRRSYFDAWHGPGPLPQGDVFAELLRRPSFMALSSVAVSRAAIAELSTIPPDIVYCPDYYICVHVAQHHTVAAVQEVCCLYRVHANNMSRAYRRQIHAEALHIIGSVAGAYDQRILRRRTLIHESLIGMEEVRSGPNFWSGVSRILWRGSLTYLVLRPFLILSRNIRHRGMR